jgi:hypothetical protein
MVSYLALVSPLIHDTWCFFFGAAAPGFPGRQSPGVFATEAQVGLMCASSACKGGMHIPYACLSIRRNREDSSHRRCRKKPRTLHEVDRTLALGHHGAGSAQLRKGLVMMSHRACLQTTECQKFVHILIWPHLPGQMSCPDLLLQQLQLMSKDMQDLTD